jgi:thiopeptide-type bacteriocin biosynthesis protein
MSRSIRWVATTRTFVCRAPLLPLEAFTRWGDLPTGERLDALRAWFAVPQVREALRLASPSLERRAAPWLDAASPGAREQADDTLQALVRYFTRMASRATPFGLCATVSCGQLAEDTCIELAAIDAVSSWTGLDGGFAATVARRLAERPETRSQETWTTNPTLAPRGDQVRFIEAERGAKECVFRLITIAVTPHLQCAIDAARRGATFDRLARALAAFDPAVTREEAEAYVADLIDYQLLWPEFDLPVTGPTAEEFLRKRYAQLPPWPDVVKAQAGRGKAPGTEDEPPPLASETGPLLHAVGMRPPLHGRLGADVVAEVARGLDLLARLPATPARPLKDFAEAFERRYGTRSVPLLEVLDEEVGIGFDRRVQGWSSPLVAGIACTEEARSVAADAPNWAVTLLERAWTDRLREVELTEDDLPSPLAEPPDFTPMAALFELLADGTIHLRGALGPSGARLLSRFAHADPLLHGAVLECLRNEESQCPGMVHAEVVFLPGDRVRNLLARPLLRQFEIPLLAASGAPADRQIALDDLRVTVLHGEVQLHSVRLGKPVMPHVTTAYDTDHASNPSLYRFLGSLESQGRRSQLVWSWGAMDGATFMPRVTSGRLVLSPATWKLQTVTVQQAAGRRGAERDTALAAVRAQLGFPRYVRFIEGDQELLVDWDNPHSVDALLGACRRRTRIELHEDLATLCGPIIRTADGRHTGEILLPFAPVVPLNGGPAVTRTHGLDESCNSRRLLPGAECLYLKLYASARDSDELLRRLDMPPLRFFFVRQSDPDPHLRLRWFGEPARLLGEALPTLMRQCHQLEQAGLVWKVQVDTYERETERYGGVHGIAFAEELFCLDSEATLHFLQRNSDGDAMWQFALASTNALLGGLGLALPERLELVQNQREALAREQGNAAEFERHTSETYRQRRSEIERALSAADDAALQVLAASVPPLAARWRAHLGAPLQPSLTSDLLHMHVNRVMSEAPRLQEAIVCDYLARYYRSSLARSGGSPRPTLRTLARAP